MNLILLMLSLPLLVGGTVLLKRGRWPRRVGTEPRCRACEYSLVGLTSDRCPECGSAISARTTVRGQRIRQPGMVWGGAGLIFTEMTCVSPEARITPGCCGLWNDEQATAYARIVDFVHNNSGARIGISGVRRRISAPSPRACPAVEHALETPKLGPLAPV